MRGPLETLYDWERAADNSPSMHEQLATDNTKEIEYINLLGTAEAITATMGLTVAAAVHHPVFNHPESASTTEQGESSTGQEVIETAVDGVVLASVALFAVAAIESIRMKYRARKQLRSIASLDTAQAMETNTV